MRHRLRRLGSRLSRIAERVVPLDLLWFVLLPLAVLRALRELPTAPRDLPARRLPAGPADRRPSALARFRFCLTRYLHQPVVAWRDRIDEPRWQRRITIVGAERVTAALGSPIVIASVHTRGTLIVSLWLHSRKVIVGTVASEPERPRDRKRRARQTPEERERMSRIFYPGSGRRMAAFLQPGRALLVMVDVPRGHEALGTWSGGQMRVATGAFRLARMAGATVLPMVAVETGRWRWRLVIGEPVPAELIAEGRYDDAATWVVEQILPDAVRYPRQAHISLVHMVQPRGAPLPAGTTTSGSTS